MIKEIQDVLGYIWKRMKEAAGLVINHSQHLPSVSKYRSLPSVVLQVEQQKVKSKSGVSKEDQNK